MALDAAGCAKRGLPGGEGTAGLHGFERREKIFHLPFMNDGLVGFQLRDPVAHEFHRAFINAG